jgi:hypothetical protein
MVRHDAITGLPTTTYTLYPVIGPDGGLEVREIHELPDDDALPTLVDASDSESDDDVVSCGPPHNAMIPDDAIAWAPGAPAFPSAAALPGDTRIWIRTVTKKGASGQRYGTYCSARTICAYRHLNTGPFAAKDLSWDLRHGTTWLRPGTHVAALASDAPWGRWGPTEGAPSWSGMVSTGRRNSTVSQIGTQVPAQNGTQEPPNILGWRDGTNDGLALDVAELQRIEALEEAPMSDQAPSLHDPQDWVARHSPRYAACAHRARLAASLDEEERLSTAPPWTPDDAGEMPFGPSFDITPAAIGSAMDLLHDIPCPHVIGQPPPPTRIAASRAKPPPPGTTRALSRLSLSRLHVVCPTTLSRMAGKPP